MNSDINIKLFKISGKHHSKKLADKNSAFGLLVRKPWDYLLGGVLISTATGSLVGRDV